jgi:sarcosine oxidase
MDRISAPNVVLGAGIIGSMAAYHLALAGEPVLVVEQFSLGHDRGSSHGAARIIRHSYADPVYARLMPWAFRMWREFEADCGCPVYLRTGGVSIAAAGSAYAAAVAANLRELDVPHLRATGRIWNRLHPVFQLPDDADCVFEPDAGLLAADQARALAIEVARQRLGERLRILAQTPIERIDLDGAQPILRGPDLEIQARRLIVAAGGWVDRLLPGLPRTRKVTRQQVLFFRPGDTVPFSIGRFPIFITMGLGPDLAFYGMPACLGMAVKVARHGGPETGPGKEDRSIDAAYIECVRAFLRAAIPALADAPIDRTETCLYTVDDQEHFQLDFYPGRADVVVASPCSGHGFKFACLTGKAAVELACLGASQFHRPEWRWDGFAQP